MSRIVPDLSDLKRRRHRGELTPAEVIIVREWMGGLFRYLVKRHDLVSFGNIADLCARVPGSVARDEACRAQALLDLEQSVLHNDFGAHPGRIVFWLTDPPQVDQRAIALNNGQISFMRLWRHPVAAELWIPRALAATWLRERDIPAPPWLVASVTFGLKLEKHAPGIPAIAQGEPPEPTPAAALSETSEALDGGDELINLKRKPPRLPRYTGKEEGFHPATIDEIDACFQYFADRLGGKILYEALRHCRMRHWLRRNKRADTSDRAIEERYKEEPNRRYHRKVGEH